MTTLTDDELAAMTVLDSDTDSQLFSSERDTQGRLKTYNKPDMTTEEKEQWKLVTNSRDEKRRRRREAKKKEGETTRKETKMTKANDESPTKKKVTFVTNQEKKDNQINQPIKQITTPPRTNQTNGLSHLFERGYSRRAKKQDKAGAFTKAENNNLCRQAQQALPIFNRTNRRSRTHHAP